jgi:hypothetical protein
MSKTATLEEDTTPILDATMTPILTARGILISCAIPALFFALFNVFFLSSSILQAVAAVIATFFELKTIKIAGAELTPKAPGVTLATIALLWGGLIWLGKVRIHNLYSRPRNSSLVRILKLSAAFPRAQYGLDPTLVWHRLLCVVPEKYLRLIDSNSIFLYFFLNLSFSAYVFAVEAFVALIWQRSLYIVVIGGMSFVLGYGFYRAAIPFAELRSVYLRSCFDLFRMDLLKQLRIPLPEKLELEFETWDTVRGLLLADADPSRVQYVTCEKDGKT